MGVRSAWRVVEVKRVQTREHTANAALPRDDTAAFDPHHAQDRRTGHTRDGNPFASGEAKIDIIKYANCTLWTNDLLA